MKTMKQYADVMLGVASGVGSFLLSYVSLTIGVCTGAVTLAIMAIRLRKEWRHRDD